MDPFPIIQAFIQDFKEKLERNNINGNNSEDYNIHRKTSKDWKASLALEISLALKGDII